MSGRDEHVLWWTDKDRAVTESLRAPRAGDWWHELFHYGITVMATAGPLIMTQDTNGEVKAWKSPRELEAFLAYDTGGGYWVRYGGRSQIHQPGRAVPSPPTEEGDR